MSAIASRLRRCMTLVAAALALCATTAVATPNALPRVQAKGTQWVRSDGTPIALKGANLGNWLLFEFWMMGQRTEKIDDQCTLEALFDQRFGRATRERLLKLFRDNWITERDWDGMARFGLNLVRVPFIWSVVEDELRPGHLRDDAWHYLDWAVAQAEARGMYVVLDLHGAVGSQGHEHHSGCAGQNKYWTTPEYQERTAWLWRQVAARYKGRTAVAGYSVLNEPWGATPEAMAAAMMPLVAAIRAGDPDAVVILPGHSAGIDAYGKPAARGLTNVAFEMHFYPGHFGWGKAGREVHRRWLSCDPPGRGTCEWQTRMQALDAPLFVGEFQPWADMDAELGAQITRASFDRYASLGWASAVWSWKAVRNPGGPLDATWGLVTNADDAGVPALDFATASLEQIERLFRSFGTLPYRQRDEVLRWMTSAQPPQPFAVP